MIGLSDAVIDGLPLCLLVCLSVCLSFVDCVFIVQCLFVVCLLSLIVCCLLFDDLSVSLSVCLCC